MERIGDHGESHREHLKKRLYLNVNAVLFKLYALLPDSGHHSALVADVIEFTFTGYLNPRSLLLRSLQEEYGRDLAYSHIDQVACGFEKVLAYVLPEWRDWQLESILITSDGEIQLDLYQTQREQRSQQSRLRLSRAFNVANYDPLETNRNRYETSRQSFCFDLTAFLEHHRVESIIGLAKHGISFEDLLRGATRLCLVYEQCELRNHVKSDDFTPADFLEVYSKTRANNPSISSSLENSIYEHYVQLIISMANCYYWTFRRLIDVMEISDEMLASASVRVSFELKAFEDDLVYCDVIRLEWADACGDYSHAPFYQNARLFRRDQF